MVKATEQAEKKRKHISPPWTTLHHSRTVEYCWPAESTIKWIHYLKPLN